MIRAKFKPVYHTGTRSALATLCESAGSAAPGSQPPLYKNRFGQRTLRRNNIQRTRATARIALTCSIRQRAVACVRTFLRKVRVW